MAVDKLVDSTQLDADLTSIANAIRTKGGTSADLAFPAGFVSAIDAIPSGGGGGGSMQSGTVTPASDTTTFSVTLDGAITNFVFYSSDFPAGIADAGWQSVGGVWFNGFGWAFMRYNDNNYVASQDRTVTATASSLSFSLQYKVVAGKTYYWYGW